MVGFWTGRTGLTTVAAAHHHTGPELHLPLHLHYNTLDGFASALPTTVHYYRSGRLLLQYH